MNDLYNGQPAPDEEYDEIDLMGLLRKLLSEWRLILKWGIVAAAAGVVVALSVVSTYSVSTYISPESSGRSSNNSLNTLASVAGVNLGNLYSSDALSPLLYPDIVGSVSFLTDLFDMPVTAEYKKETIECNYYEYILNCQKSPWYSYVISLPSKAIRAIAGLFESDEDKEPKGFKKLESLDKDRLTKPQAGVVAHMRHRIKVIVDKKDRVISLSVTDQNPEIAKQLADAIIDNLKKYITDYRTEKARKDLEYYEQLYSEAQTEYYDVQRRYANYVDKNQGLSSHSVMIERERLQNEVQLRFQLYNSCAQQVQVAKAQVQRETPVCAVINSPSVPLKDNESGIKILAVCILLGLCLASYWVLRGREMWSRFKNSGR